VRIDLLSSWASKASAEPSKPPAEPAPGEPKPTDHLHLKDLAFAPFAELRRDLDSAALLGLPILLEGERGSGKTFLAEYFHQRRQEFRAGNRQSRAHPYPVRPGKPEDGKCYAPARSSERDNFVAITLSEFGDVRTLRDTLFGWARGAFNAAEQAYDGLLGQADGGTLFLDEVHRLHRTLQGALLGPLNNGRYRPLMAPYELYSRFDLVVATNDPKWRDALAEDFRDRIERIVLRVPSFRALQRDAPDAIWRFWEHTIQDRCRRCGIEYTRETSEGSSWSRCEEVLRMAFHHRPLRGNWRDLQRLADNLLLRLTEHQDGRPQPLRWNLTALETAINQTFAET
jgi:transcriptional regulator with AAA-type ATPase domain